MDVYVRSVHCSVSITLSGLMDYFMHCDVLVGAMLPSRIATLKRNLGIYKNSVFCVYTLHITIKFGTSYNFLDYEYCKCF